MQFLPDEIEREILLFIPPFHARAVSKTWHTILGGSDTFMKHRNITPYISACLSALIKPTRFIIFKMLRRCNQYENLKPEMSFNRIGGPADGCQARPISIYHTPPRMRCCAEVRWGGRCSRVAAIGKIMCAQHSERPQQSSWWGSHLGIIAPPIFQYSIKIS